jgi:chromosome segregation ATPase
LDLSNICSELRGRVDELQAELYELRSHQADMPTLLLAAEEAAGRAIVLEQTLEQVRPQLATARKDLDATRTALEQEQQGKVHLQSTLQMALHTVRLREQEADMLQRTANGVLRDHSDGLVMPMHQPVATGESSGSNASLPVSIDDR